MFSDKSCREYQNTHFMFSNFYPENCVLYEIMQRIMLEENGPQITTSI